MSKADFLNTVAPIIVSEAKARGYKYPSAIIAQAACESNWGKSELSSKYFNFFGMKCGSSWRGKSVNFKTMEEYSGVSVSIRDNFRAYDSVASGIAGYFDFISMKRYQNLKDSVSPTDYIERLKKSGWATSSKYVSTLSTILAENNLQHYDTGYAQKVFIPQSQATSTRKTNEQIADEVIRGKWGVNPQRKKRLTAAGYNYSEIQSIVNKRLRK